MIPALSIAGFDPSAGAGLLADIKSFEAQGVYGFGVCTGLTVQNDAVVDDVQWTPIEVINAQIDILFERYAIDWVKIGLIENFEVLAKVVERLHRANPSVKIIWDPVLKASTGFIFHRQIDRQAIETLCKDIWLITPNLFEISRLMPGWGEVDAAAYLSARCKVLLKGGHDSGIKVKDLLFEGGEPKIFTGDRILGYDKHGTGCVLSSTITALLAQGKTLEESCRTAKAYVEQFIRSNDSNLGYHRTMSSASNPITL